MAFPASPSALTSAAAGASTASLLPVAATAGPSPGPESESDPTPVLAILEAENETVFFAGRRRLRLPSIAALLDGVVAPSSSSSCGVLLLTQLKRYLVQALDLDLTTLTTAEEEDNKDTAGKNTYAALQLEVYDTRHQIFVPLGSSSSSSASHSNSKSNSNFNNDKVRMEEETQQRSRLMLIFARRCCRLRLSSTYNNSNETASTTEENRLASSLLALPWREFVTVPVSERFQYTCPRASTHALQFPVPQTDTTITIVEVSNTPAVQTSGTLWDGAVRLMQFVAYHSSTTTTMKPRPNPWYSVRHKTILEVGAGTGLVGLAAGHALHAHRVVVTDVPLAMPNLRHNLAQNTTRAAAEEEKSRDNSTRRSHITAQVLDWCDFTTCDAVLSFVDDGESGPGVDMNSVVTLAKSTLTTWIPDLILAADVIWVEALVLPFVRTLHRICSSRATATAAPIPSPPSSPAAPPRPLILLAYQRRSLRVETVLFQTLHEYSFQYEDVTTTTATTVLPVSKIRIYCLRWSPGGSPRV